MSGLDRDPNKKVLRKPDRLHTIVFAPDGAGYEIEAIDSYRDAAGSPPIMDLFLWLRAFIRRRKGKEWQVVVRPTRDVSGPVHTSHVATAQDAESLVEEIADRIHQSGVDNLDV
jgi:hypothetical protein